MIKLKPCPFCGSEMIELNKLVIVNTWCAICVNCGCTGPGEHETANQVARAWNMRYAFKTKSAALYGKSVRGE